MMQETSIKILKEIEESINNNKLTNNKIEENTYFIPNNSVARTISCPVESLLYINNCTKKPFVMPVLRKSIMDFLGCDEKKRINSLIQKETEEVYHNDEYYDDNYDEFYGVDDGCYNCGSTKCWCSPWE